MKMMPAGIENIAGDHFGISFCLRMQSARAILAELTMLGEDIRKTHFELSRSSLDLWCSSLILHVPFVLYCFPKSTCDSQGYIYQLTMVVSS